MFIDIVFPSGNEKEFIKQAKKLDAKGLIFFYNKVDKNIIGEIKELNKKSFPLFIASSTKAKGVDYLIVDGSRKNFENGNNDFIIGLEGSPKKDKTHYRFSGLNQVLCKLATEKNIKICFSFNDLLNSKKREIVLGRMIQNMHFCKKYKTPVFIASFAKKPIELRSWKDLRSFGVVLGLDAKKAKKALSF